MRAGYVNPSNLLTPVGEWIAARLPHVDNQRGLWGKPGNCVFRVFGGRPLYRMCIFDYTRASLVKGKPWMRIQVCGWTVFERNREFSGLPDARR